MKLFGFVLILLLSSCSLVSDNCGSDEGISRSSLESKEYGIFISYYDMVSGALVNPLDSTKIKIKEIYREYQFTIGDDNEIIPSKESRIIMIAVDTIPDSYWMDWEIGEYDKEYFTAGKDNMDADLNGLQKFDTLKFIIREGRYSKTPFKQLGELVLVERKTAIK